MTFHGSDDTDPLTSGQNTYKFPKYRNLTETLYVDRNKWLFDVNTNYKIYNGYKSVYQIFTKGFGQCVITQYHRHFH